MRRWTRAKAYFREFKFVAKALLSTDHPVLAHVIPIRRCNLTCGYCNEYNTSGAPVPTDTMIRRLDRLGDLGLGAVVISGGEPLLHPDLDQMIAHIRHRGMLVGLISNCYLMTEERIRRLNRAGLEYLQVSIDNVEPDEVSKKSLRLLDRKLQWLSQLAEFKVNINSVIGGGIKTPQDALTIGRRAVELGFSSSLGIIHDTSGTLKPLHGLEREVFFKMKGIGKKGYSRIHYFQDALVDGKSNRWRCRAGARYLYVCEDGLVHYCSQQRGYPGIPLEQYTLDDIRREYLTPKACAPYCTIGCVHQVATVDFWRDPQILDTRGRAIRKPIPATEAIYQVE
jgi:MoaA/NifB/PqqE/SkfB family radical SAM enzyme